MPSGITKVRGVLYATGNGRRVPFNVGRVGLRGIVDRVLRIKRGICSFLIGDISAFSRASVFDIGELDVRGSKCRVLMPVDNDRRDRRSRRFVEGPL